MNIKTLTKTKSFWKLPTSISTHSVFSKIKKIKRIFPYIGLKNCLEPCDVAWSGEVFKGKKTYIGFSSSGATGLWDIATMSMRGVCSCMHWDNAHSRHLIGSITDPFLGIVYITDNEKTPYGISFRRRALVRFVYSPANEDYRLLIERPYLDTGNTDPFVYHNKDPHALHTLEIFRKFLISKVNNKYKVILHSEKKMDNAGYAECIPRSTGLDLLDDNEQSMSDCMMGYRNKNIQNDVFVEQFANQN